MAGEWELDELQGPFQPKLFYGSIVWGKLFFMFSVAQMLVKLRCLDKLILFLAILGDMNNKGILCSLIHFLRSPKRIGTVGLEED